MTQNIKQPGDRQRWHPLGYKVVCMCVHVCNTLWSDLMSDISQPVLSQNELRDIPVQLKPYIPCTLLAGHNPWLMPSAYSLLGGLKHRLKEISHPSPVSFVFLSLLFLPVRVVRSVSIFPCTLIPKWAQNPWTPPSKKPQKEPFISDCTKDKRYSYRHHSYHYLWSICHTKSDNISPVRRSLLCICYVFAYMYVHVSILQTCMLQPVSELTFYKIHHWG